MKTSDKKSCIIGAVALVVTIVCLGLTSLGWLDPCLAIWIVIPSNIIVALLCFRLSLVAVVIAGLLTGSPHNCSAQPAPEPIIKVSTYYTLHEREPADRDNAVIACAVLIGGTYAGIKLWQLCKKKLGTNSTPPPPTNRPIARSTVTRSTHGAASNLPVLDLDADWQTTGRADYPGYCEFTVEHSPDMQTWTDACHVQVWSGNNQTASVTSIGGVCISTNWGEADVKFAEPEMTGECGFVRARCD